MPKQQRSSGSDLSSRRRGEGPAGGASGQTETGPGQGLIDARRGDVCPLCGARDAEPLFFTTEHLSGRQFEIVRCPTCGLARTAGIPAGVGDHEFYGAAYYGHAGRRFPRFMEALVARFRGHRARMVRRRRPEAGAILDVGCGRALMLSYLRAKGWTCVGVERSGELAESASEIYGLDVRVGEDALGGLDSGRFDVVTLWHVLEHIPAPLDSLSEIRRLLKPDGWLLVEVPNLDSIQARAGGGEWFHLDPPRHRCHFSPNTLRSLLSKAGLKVEAESTCSWEYGPYGMGQTLLNRIAPYPNIFYGVLQGQGTTMAGRAGRPWVALSVVLALPAFAAGLALESAAMLLGKGAVLRVWARP